MWVCSFASVSADHESTGENDKTPDTLFCANTHHAGLQRCFCPRDHEPTSRKKLGRLQTSSIGTNFGEQSFKNCNTCCGGLQLHSLGQRDQKSTNSSCERTLATDIRENTKQSIQFRAVSVLIKQLFLSLYGILSYSGSERAL